MKKRSKSKTGKQPQSLMLQIEFHSEHVQSVSIAGTFNDWRPGVTRMTPLGGGRWAKELSLPPGRYEYRFVVDGEWICDPAAAQTVSNPYGGQNAVLLIGSGS